jgi:hypothetical protein
MAEIHLLETYDAWKDRRVERPGAVGPVHSRQEGEGQSGRRDPKPRKPFRVWLREAAKPETAPPPASAEGEAGPTLNILA